MADVIPIRPDLEPPAVRKARRRLAWYLLGTAIVLAPETDAIRRQEYDDTVTHYVRTVTPTGQPAWFAAIGLWAWAGWHLLVDKRRPAAGPSAAQHPSSAGGRP